MQQLLTKGCFTFLIAFIHLNSFGQTANVVSYLQIRFEKNYDEKQGTTYYTLQAENGCDSAIRIYSLLHYNGKKNALNSRGGFYHVTKDRAGEIYNYFVSPTEGLNFLSGEGWTLVSTYNDVSSRSNWDNSTVTAISSRTVFVFRK